MKKRKLIILLAAVGLILTFAAGLFWYDLNATRIYTYPISTEQKNYTVTVETNWNSAPEISLDTSVSNRHAVDLDFSGSCKKTVFFNITIPATLLSGNITLIWKYYPLNTSQYTLSNNGTHNSVWFKFDYTGSLSGEGHFELVGT
jgi:hypothetical protein